VLTASNPSHLFIKNRYPGERDNGEIKTVRLGDGAERKYLFAYLNKDCRIEQSDKIQGNLMSTFTAVLHKEDDRQVAECTEAGTVSQGSTVEEVVSTLRKQPGFAGKNFLRQKRNGRS
jgi:hypothetical protein